MVKAAPTGELPAKHGYVVTYGTRLRAGTVREIDGFVTNEVFEDAGDAAETATDALRKNAVGEPPGTWTEDAEPQRDGDNVVRCWSTIGVAFTRTCIWIEQFDMVPAREPGRGQRTPPEKETE